MRASKTLSGARGAKISGRKELSSRMFFIAAALAIVLIACVLGRATFQSDSDAWKPRGDRGFLRGSVTLRAQGPRWLGIDVRPMAGVLAVNK